MLSDRFRLVERNWRTRLNHSLLCPLRLLVLPLPYSAELSSAVLGGVLVKLLLTGRRAEVVLCTIADTCVLRLAFRDVHSTDRINRHISITRYTYFVIVSKTSFDSDIPLRGFRKSRAATLTTNHPIMLFPNSHASFENSQDRAQVIQNR